MTEHYDVIIIGSGAGGGTLAHTLADSGKRILLLERGDFLPREMDNWDPEAGVRRRQVHLRGHLVRRRRQAVPAAGALLRRRRDQAVRRRAVPAAPAGLRRAQARRRRLAGVAARLRRLRAVVHEGRVALPGARQRRRGPDRGPSVEAVPVAGGVARAAHPAAVRRPAGGWLPPVPRARAASCSTRPTGPRARASAARGATATRASSTPSPTPRPSRCARCSTAQRHAARQRRGDQARDRRRAAAPSPASSVAAAGSQEVYEADIVVVVGRRGEHRQAAARARRTTSTRTAWPTAPTRSDATTCSTTARPSSRCPRSRTTRSSRRRSASTTSTSARDDYEWPVGNIQMVGKSNAEAMKGEEPKLTKLAPHWSLAETARARRRLLAHHRGPARSRTTA